MGDTLRIPVGKHHFAVVDAEDAELVRRCKWWLKGKRENRLYAWGRPFGPGPKVLMHRFLLGLTDPRQECDHRDNDGLNNRRSNLRPATRHENARNISTRNGVSGFKGVFPSAAKTPRWFARLKMNKKRIYLGTFATREEAAMRYNVAARQLFGDFAHLNQVEMG